MVLAQPAPMRNVALRFSNLKTPKPKLHVKMIMSTFSSLFVVKGHLHLPLLAVAKLPMLHLPLALRSLRPCVPAAKPVVQGLDVPIQKQNGSTISRT